MSKYYILAYCIFKAMLTSITEVWEKDPTWSSIIDDISSTTTTFLSPPYYSTTPTQEHLLGSLATYLKEEVTHLSS